MKYLVALAIASCMVCNAQLAEVYLTQTIVEANPETGIKATTKADQYTLVHRDGNLVMVQYTPNQVTYTTATVETFADLKELVTRVEELRFVLPDELAAEGAK